MHKEHCDFDIECLRNILTYLLIWTNCVSLFRRSSSPS